MDQLIQVAENVIMLTLQLVALPERVIILQITPQIVIVVPTLLGAQQMHFNINARQRYARILSWQQMHSAKML